MKILIDAMGGDNAPEAPAKAAEKAARELGCEIALIGREELLAPLVSGKNGLSVIHAPEVVSMEDSYAISVVSKKESSMMKALTMLKNGEGDAVISAGSTGALLTGATLIVKRIKGIKRAALATVFPRTSGRGLLLDSGANVDCTPEMLVQFAMMGHIYAKSQMAISSPRVALLNNGTEAGKGTGVLKQTHELLSVLHGAGKINFIGNLEGRDIFTGPADVFVCDGFTGNIALKSIEGTASYIMRNMKSVLSKNIFTKLGALMVKDGLIDIKNSLDYREVGGVPFLGTSGVVIKAHGSSDERAFYNACLQAAQCIRSGYISEIEKCLPDLASD